MKKISYRLLGEFFRGVGVEIVNKKPKKGAFWIIAGLEFRYHMELLKEFGIKAIHTEKGGRASKYKPAWYIK